MKIFNVLILLLFVVFLQAQNTTVQIALLKYRGGGDWYANPTSLPNLIKFCNKEMGTSINPEPVTVDVGSSDIFNYSFIHMTGHGNVIFSAQEASNLRTYLTSGGFLHIDDNYGLNEFARREMKKVFPELDFVELPFTHPIYKQKYSFDKGLPKIHEHDNKAPQGFGLVYQGTLVCFYSYETDLGDGWEDEAVHNDPPEKRMAALKMGANLIMYVFDRQ
ncbi:MAG: hypothetical protein CVU05_13260 [Bacteroidetes bacterium HGW-Bacteroidetes-21]|nr:MAG: hypothetical protein CVU05_13260 [Bacteroidetes bacterium HGW-Bacteroidetes-21]